MGVTLGEVAGLIGARLDGDSGFEVAGPAALEEAGAADITFADDVRRVEQVRCGSAGAIVVAEDFPALPGRNLLRVASPRLGFLRVMELFAPPRAVTGVDARAVVSPEAKLGEEVSIGACAVVGPGARIGARTTIGAGAVIGQAVQIGEDCTIDANATVLDGVRIGDRCVVHPGAVIGREGFGFQWLGDHHHRVPQLGTVVLEDDVEVGCNACVDRATLGETRIGLGTKIDNLVQVGHNNRIGRHVILAGNVGLAGSVTIGDGAVLGGGVGVSDHVRIGAGARVGGAAAVTKDVAEGDTVWGAPARGMQRVMRELAALGRLPQVLRHLKALTRRIEHLEAASSAAPGKHPEH